MNSGNFFAFFFSWIGQRIGWAISFPSVWLHWRRSQQCVCYACAADRQSFREWCADAWWQGRVEMIETFVWAGASTELQIEIRKVADFVFGVPPRGWQYRVHPTPPECTGYPHG